MLGYKVVAQSLLWLSIATGTLVSVDWSQYADT